MNQQKILKYRKRHWQKIIGKVYSIKILAKGIQIVIYKKNAKVMALCLNPDLYSLIKELRINTKVNIWVSTKSVYQKTLDKWTTNLYLMHIEKPPLKNTNINSDNQQYKIQDNWNTFNKK